MSSNIFTIALDGPSGTGKSTTAKEVARNLNILYLDTGAMYRTISFLCLEKNISSDDESAIVDLAKSVQISLGQDGSVQADGRDLSEEIRTPEVSDVVSHYVVHALVREVVTDKLREISQGCSCILDGRDIGTVVFPNANWKFFMTADYRIRAERRQQELSQKGIEISVDEVEANLRQRDEVDSNRKSSPLRKADDAIEIDTTRLTIQEQVEQILEHVGVVT